MRFMLKYEIIKTIFVWVFNLIIKYLNVLLYVHNIMMSYYIKLTF